MYIVSPGFSFLLNKRELFIQDHSDGSTLCDDPQLLVPFPVRGLFIHALCHMTASTSRETEDVPCPNGRYGHIPSLTKEDTSKHNVHSNWAETWKARNVTARNASADFGISALCHENLRAWVSGMTRLLGLSWAEIQLTWITTEIWGWLVNYSKRSPIQR